MTDRKVDFEYELSNGWDPSVNVILRAIRQIDERVAAVEEKVDEVKSTQDQINGAWQTVKIIAAAAGGLITIGLAVAALIN